ncbi:MAG: acylphosphatase [Atopobiaceae bacterium]|nr:acylphosphatase [Atopobiaceae bacterium]
MSELRRVHVVFVGQVQGVGFRWTAQATARDVGATGWVINERDGSVTMEVQGTDTQISEFFGKFDRSYARYRIQYEIYDKYDMAIDPEETEFVVRFVGRD